MNEYEELMTRQQKEVNDFPCFFAFNMQQFEEGMKSLGLKKTDTKLIYKAPSGMFYKKEDSPKLKELLDRHDRERKEAIAADTTGEGYIYEMFKTELANHEFGYTRELEETLSFIGLTLAEVKKSDALTNGLRKALKKYRCDIW